MVLTFDALRWQHTQQLATDLVAAQQLKHIGLATGTPYEQQSWSLTPGAPNDVRWLVASLSKPLLACVLMRAVEQGRLGLQDRVCDWLPEFQARGKYGIEVIHLLTHSSGLPEHAANHHELRRQHAPPREFVRIALQEDLAFAPGRGQLYSNIGFGAIGGLLEAVFGSPLPQVLQQHLQHVPGVTRTTLGAHDGDCGLPVEVPPDQTGGDNWNWNSRYWRTGSAAWGGLLSTPRDLAQLSQHLLKDDGWLHPALRSAMWRRQTDHLPDLPAVEQRLHPWGCGWRHEWPWQPLAFGDWAASGVVGHWGATGCLWWIEPATGIFGIVFSTTPMELSRKHLQRLSTSLRLCWRQTQ